MKRPLALATALLFTALAAGAEPQTAPRPEAEAAPAVPPAPQAKPAIEVPPGMALYYMVLLKRGPKWTPEVTDETKKIQEGHMANIQRMADSGKMVLAGPFLDGGELRGIFLFKVDSAEEAKAMMDSDPAVQAGRLIGEIHPWMTDARVIQTGLQTPK
jgi:uncharacterized protein YciI